MSSILKALKKLEQKGTEPRGLQIWLSPQGRRRLLTGPVLIGVGLLLVGGISFGIYRLRPVSDPPDTGSAIQHRASPSKTARHKVAVPQTAPRQPRTIQRNSSQTSRPPSTFKPANTLRAPAAQSPGAGRQSGISATRPVRPPSTTSRQPSAPAAPPKRSSQPNPSQTASGTASPSPTRDAAERPQSRPPRPTVASKPSAPPSTPQTAAVKRNLLNDPKIEIQAISWAPEPEGRIVVINSRILREGATIEGYRVTQINPDDVVLVRGGREYTAALILR